ncbi:uncharacterized protein L203_104720 [Cryptococcus depauperatus CBS 7841]|uniref:Uncharacterized protein n=1 Tax=Cryptococcus depauperatus CBS 7841 TaxID=1295531 RepID=A0AAJ8JW10_9TREE
MTIGAAPIILGAFAVVGTGYLVKKFVYDPHLAPILDAWQKQFQEQSWHQFRSNDCLQERKEHEQDMVAMAIRMPSTAVAPTDEGYERGLRRRKMSWGNGSNPEKARPADIPEPRKKSLVNQSPEPSLSGKSHDLMSEMSSSGYSPITPVQNDRIHLNGSDKMLPTRLFLQSFVDIGPKGSLLNEDVESLPETAASFDNVLEAESFLSYPTSAQLSPSASSSDPHGPVDGFGLSFTTSPILGKVRGAMSVISMSDSENEHT